MIAPFSGTDSVSAAGAPNGPALGERDRAILDQLSRAGSLVAFQGLRRRLGLHPQALTRSLRNLQSRGYVTRDADGYRLGPNATPSPSERAPAGSLVPFRPVFAALVPAHVESARLADRLAHRWFQGLRWFGRASDRGEHLLTWLTDEEGRQVRLRIARGMLGVELESRPDAPLAFDSLAPLLEAVASFYATLPRRPELPERLPPDGALRSAA